MAAKPDAPTAAPWHYPRQLRSLGRGAAIGVVKGEARHAQPAESCHAWGGRGAQTAALALPVGHRLAALHLDTGQRVASRHDADADGRDSLARSLNECSPPALSRLPGCPCLLAESSTCLNTTPPSYHIMSLLRRLGVSWNALRGHLHRATPHPQHPAHTSQTPAPHPPPPPKPVGLWQWRLRQRGGRPQAHKSRPPMHFMVDFLADRSLGYRQHQSGPSSALRYGYVCTHIRILHPYTCIPYTSNREQEEGGKQKNDLSLGCSLNPHGSATRWCG